MSQNLEHNAFIFEYFNRLLLRSAEIPYIWWVYPTGLSPFENNARISFFHSNTRFSLTLLIVSWGYCYLCYIYGAIRKCPTSLRGLLGVFWASWPILIKQFKINQDVSGVIGNVTFGSGMIWVCLCGGGASIWAWTHYLILFDSMALVPPTCVLGSENEWSVVYDLSFNTEVVQCLHCSGKMGTTGITP